MIMNIFVVITVAMVMLLRETYSVHCNLDIGSCLALGTLTNISNDLYSSEFTLIYWDF